MSYNFNHRTSSAQKFKPRSYGTRTTKGRSRKEYIDSSRFVKAARQNDVEAYHPVHTFSDFSLHPILEANIKDKGFTVPSAIQDQAIPVGLTGRDVIGIANTGTGKTIAFALPVLHALMSNTFSRAIILAPTRELATQIEEECRSIAKESKLFGALLIGGTPMNPQLYDLRQKPRIVIGTPGRIKDHVERGSLNLSDFNMVILDEVDRMLDMGFINDMRFILNQLPVKRQSFFFSATLDHKVRALVDNFANDPVTISVKTGETTDNVEQSIVTYNSKEEKIDKLHTTLIKDGVQKVLVFDETQRNVERLCKELQSRGFNADAIHGGKTQGQRDRALKRFKTNAINILVATDVAARGIDVSDITHVINYAQPNSYDDYVHRIGRAGRAGKTGHALTFVEK